MHMRTPKPVERDLLLLAPMANCRQCLGDCCAGVASFSSLVTSQRLEQAAPERLLLSMVRLRRRWQSCRCRRRCSGWSGSLRRSTPCARSCSRSTSRRVAPGRPPAFFWAFASPRSAFLLGHGRVHRVVKVSSCPDGRQCAPNQRDMSSAMPAGDLAQRACGGARLARRRGRAAGRRGGHGRARAGRRAAPRPAAPAPVRPISWHSVPCLGASWLGNGGERGIAFDICSALRACGVDRVV